jgi:hypothetical protein
MCAHQCIALIIEFISVTLLLGYKHIGWVGCLPFLVASWS